jgi:hypothetical protein
VRAGPAAVDMGSLVSSVYQRPLEARQIGFGKGKEIANRRFRDITAGDRFSAPGEAICSLMQDLGN